MGFQGQLPGTVSLRQHKVRQLCQHFHGQRRGGELAVFAGCTGTEDSSGSQRLPDVRRRRVFQHRVFGKRTDMGGGAENDRPRNLLRQTAQQTGLAAAADDGGNARPDIQRLAEFHSYPSRRGFLSVYGIGPHLSRGSAIYLCGRNMV